jgi:hypothetical protein
MQAGSARLGAIVWWDRSAVGKVAVVALLAWTVLALAASGPEDLLRNAVSASFVAAAWCGTAAAVRRLRCVEPPRTARAPVTARVTVGR